MPDPTPPAPRLTAEQRKKLEHLSMSAVFSKGTSEAATAALALIDHQAHELAALKEVAVESNAVCACGCPAEDHENYGEDGEACPNEDHECVRTCPAVLSMLAALRAQVETIREQTLAEAIEAVRGVTVPYSDSSAVLFYGSSIDAPSFVAAVEALRQPSRPPTE